MLFPTSTSSVFLLIQLSSSQIHLLLLFFLFFLFLIMFHFLLPAFSPLRPNLCWGCCGSSHSGTEINLMRWRGLFVLLCFSMKKTVFREQPDLSTPGQFTGLQFKNRVQQEIDYDYLSDVDTQHNWAFRGGVGHEFEVRRGWTAAHWLKRVWIWALLGQWQRMGKHWGLSLESNVV